MSPPNSGSGGGSAGPSSGEDQGGGGGPGNSLWKNYKAIQLARNPSVSTDQLHSRFKAMSAEQKVGLALVLLPFPFRSSPCLTIPPDNSQLDAGFISR